MKKTKTILFRNLILSLVLLVTIFIVVYSWFSNIQEASASGIRVTCDAPEGIEIAVVEHGAKAPDDSEYSNSITLDETGFFAKLLLSEVSSDGINFIKPILTQQNGIVTPNTNKDWDLAFAPGQDYICFDLYIRTRSQRNVYINSESSFSPVSSRLTWQDNESVSAKDNASTYGSFSRDAIIGAARASIVGYDAEKNPTNLKLLWIPRPDIFLNQDGSDYSVLTELDENNKYGTYIHKYWNSNKEMHTAKNAVASVLNSETKSVNLGSSYMITDFNSHQDGAVIYDDETKYYYTHVIYNTWIEGEDSEARLALSGGKFMINLKLSDSSTKG